MALVLDEGVLFARAELLLGNERLPIVCRITVEWLRGIPEPTWYGYFTQVSCEPRVLPLPGPYHLRLPNDVVQILLRRPSRDAPETSFPFWGIGAPPHVERGVPPQQR